MKKLKILFQLILLNFTIWSCAQTTDWKTASKESAQIAPLPSEEKEAIVQIYAAKTVSWRGHFSVHSWIATKEKNASEYMTYHVIGWRLRSGQSVVRSEIDIPDRRWYGAIPTIVASYKGIEAEKMIPFIETASKNYPYHNVYRAWPGPNSNTYISHIIRSTPGMGIELPSNAIGKDWIHAGDVFGYSETKSGVQFSLLGSLGFTLGLGEGVEINLLGLSFGIDFLRPALKLPMIGRLGMKDQPVF